MALYSESIGSQTDKTDEFPHKQINKCREIYTQRKDINDIKSQLEKFVRNTDYWSIVSKFIYGELTKPAFDEAMQMYLPNKTAKKLHNQLIRMILFNAHYSTVPPPNTDLSIYRAKPKDTTLLIDQLSKIQNYGVKKSKTVRSYLSIDLKHIPSLYQLKIRLANNNISIDENGLHALFAGIKMCVSLLLTKSISMSIKGNPNSPSRTISPHTVLYVLNKNPALKSMLSSTIIAKWQIDQI